MLVLAVDDDDDDLELFGNAAQEIDPSIQIIYARNGEEALRYLHERAIAMPDYVFLDVNMPRVNGRQCLISMRENKLTKNIPVIMYSTALSESDIALFENLNARYLIKPSGYVELVAALKKILGSIKDEWLEPLEFPEL